jgi:hypothetical protein
MKLENFKQATEILRKQELINDIIVDIEQQLMQPHTGNIKIRTSQSCGTHKSIEIATKTDIDILITISNVLRQLNEDYNKRFEAL